MKTLPFTMSHNFKTVAQLYLGQSVAGLSPQRPVFEHRSFHLAFAIQNSWWRRAAGIPINYDKQLNSTLARNSCLQLMLHKFIIISISIDRRYRIMYMSYLRPRHVTRIAATRLGCILFCLRVSCISRG